MYVNIRAAHSSAAIEVEEANVLFSQQEHSDKATIGLLDKYLPRNSQRFEKELAIFKSTYRT